MVNDKLMKNVKSEMKNGNLKVAIVCDWLVGTGGAERVVLELHKMFPDAPIYTSQYDPNPKTWYGDKWFAGADIKTTWLQKLPKSLRKFLPVLRAWSFSRLNLKDFDLVISSSGAEAKGVKTGKNTVHVSYIHAPTHYYWSRYDEYLKNPGFGILDPLARLGLKLLVGSMRRWDKKAAGRPDYLIANSTHTQNQVKKYYGREAGVIHPPVDIERFRPSAPINREGFVVAGRQTPYKRIDLAVAACTKLDLPLAVIGNGPDHEKLMDMAGPTIKFLTDVPDEDMPLYSQKSEAFLFPGLDDFGIVAVEALAAGTPVIAYKDGGALDYVNPDTGLLFTPQSTEGLIQQLKEFSKKQFDHTSISEYADNFSADKFHYKFKSYIETILKKD